MGPLPPLEVFDTTMTLSLKSQSSSKRNSQSRVNQCSPDQMHRRNRPYPQEGRPVPIIPKKQVMLPARPADTVFTGRNLAFAVGICVLVMCTFSETSTGSRRRLGVVYTRCGHKGCPCWADKAIKKCATAPLNSTMIKCKQCKTRFCGKKCKTTSWGVFWRKGACRKTGGIICRGLNAEGICRTCRLSPGEDEDSPLEPDHNIMATLLGKHGESDPILSLTGAPARSDRPLSHPKIVSIAENSAVITLNGK